MYLYLINAPYFVNPKGRNGLVSGTLVNAFKGFLMSSSAPNRGRMSIEMPWVSYDKTPIPMLERDKLNVLGCNCTRLNSPLIF